jgi:hypothetical protein
MNDPINKKDLPFPRHWMGYMAIKIIMLIVAVLLALYLAGMI